MIAGLTCPLPAISVCDKSAATEPKEAWGLPQFPKWTVGVIYQQLSQKVLHTQKVALSVDSWLSLNSTFTFRATEREETRSEESENWKRKPAAAILHFQHVKCPELKFSYQVPGRGLILYSRSVLHSFLNIFPGPLQIWTGPYSLSSTVVGLFCLLKCAQSSRINFRPWMLLKLRLFLAQFPRPLFTLQYTAWHHAQQSSRSRLCGKQLVSRLTFSSLSLLTTPANSDTRVWNLSFHQILVQRTPSCRRLHQLHQVKGNRRRSFFRSDKAELYFQPSAITLITCFGCGMFPLVQQEILVLLLQLCTAILFCSILSLVLLSAVFAATRW